MNTESKLSEDDELFAQLSEAGLEVEYLSKWGKYRLRLRPGEIENNKELLDKLFKLAYDSSQA